MGSVFPDGRRAANEFRCASRLPQAQDFASDSGAEIVIHGRLTGRVPVVIALRKKFRQMPDLAEWPEQLGKRNMTRNTNVPGNGTEKVKSTILCGLLATVVVVACTACNGFFVDPVLTSVQVGPAGVTLLVGATQQYQATGTYNDGSVKSLSSIVWSSSPTTSASISTTGLVKGIAAGAVTITASSGTVSGTATLTVQTAPLQSISISPTNPTKSLSSGGVTQQFTATGKYTDGTSQDITSTVTWTSTVPTVATIDASGLATGIKVGTTSIQATTSNIVGFTNMSVTN